MPPEKKITVKKLPKKRSQPSKKTEIVILGLTPGKQQHEAIIKATIAREAAFKGFMRKQMFEWFQYLKIDKFLNLENEDSLFTKKYLSRVYITSLLRDPVYIQIDSKLKNYTGRNPYPWNDKDLLLLMKDTIKQLNKLHNSCLIIPLGQVVSMAIQNFSELDDDHYVLHGFPHPSGANGHRKKEFLENRRELRKIAQEYFDS